MEAYKLSEEELNNMDKKLLVRLVLSLQESVEPLNENTSLLMEQIKLMNSRKYSNKTETLDSLSTQLSLDLFFNEAEDLSDEEKEEPVIETVIRKRKQKGNRVAFLKKVTNHKNVYLLLSEEELNDRYSEGKWKRLPDEIISKLEHHPASFEVVSYHIGVYVKDDNEMIVKADKSSELFEGSIVTPSLLSSFIFAKYVNGVPLYRQEIGLYMTCVFV